MSTLIRWIKPKGAEKYHVTVIEKGRTETFIVDDIVVDSGVDIRIGGKETTRGWVVTPESCRIVEIETLPGIKEKILACTKKTIRELRELVKYT
mgnify:CR=1 FL=1